MALVLKKLYHAYFWVFNDMADHRSDDIHLVSSPLIPLSIIVAYLYFVNTLGPKLMENRKPFQLKNVIRLYNATQVLLNIFIMYKAGKRLLVSNWDCAPIDFSTSHEALEEMNIVYYFYLLKLLDLVDTVFFVLRKSYRQVSFLHTYHHSGMLWALWMGVRFFPGGHGLWVLAINAFVHAVMFSYYFLTTVDDEWKKSIRFKKTLTQIQLIQFFTFVVIYSRLLLKSDCLYPKLVSYLFVPQNVFMMLLFGDFYLKTYVFTKKKTVKNT